MADPFPPAPQSFGTLSPYTPSLRERLIGAMQNAIGGTANQRGTASDFAENAGNVLGMVPGVSNVLGADDAVRQYQGGHPFQAALTSAMALPIPSAGAGGMRSIEDIAEKWASKGVKLDLAQSANGPINLSRIVVPPEQRGQGLGSAAMNDIIQHADENGKTVTLSPSTDFGGSSVSRLKDFYKQFGFVSNSGRNKDFSISDTMYRPASPQPTQATDAGQFPQAPPY
jgi:GNAT superfamily N-acetyltransferase